ncbi:hypothetical protein DACRYDRAFT_114882 [Dacryopinax primogenitus]|uniref:Nuclear pore complex protein Nup85 n=1 Tax=Dacryopinax primogenitus (strain DJM 731) TaxID=1858805 RepID=M5G480_DACPD|nr:uncharacterized protein DACRYDRAFT_114882 [Dacryopinax primogenitus]EJU03489.1 hypothetical protein DACRYDRAFT_114882 [Dacryopinax primogenitus]
MPNDLHVKYSVGKKGAFPKELGLISATSSRGTTMAMATTRKTLDLTSKRKKPSKREGNVWMVNIEGYTAEMRKLYIATHPVFSSAQLLWDTERRDNPITTDIGLPSQTSVAHYSRCWAQYRRQIDNAESPSPELQAISSIVFLVQVLYLPESGFNTGIVGEELLDWLNTIDVRPTTEEVEEFSQEDAWKLDGFWSFLQRLVLRGHFEMAQAVLERLMDQHPSAILSNVIRTSLIPLLESFPRPSAFNHQSQFEEARFRWDASLKTTRKNFEGMLKSEKGDWVQAIRGIFEIMDGQEQRILALVNDGGIGWVEAAGVWGVWVDPSMTRSDLTNNVLDHILEVMPLDPTDNAQALMAALMGGDSVKVLFLAAEASSWLVAHLVDMFQRMQFLDEAYLEGGESQNIRSFYILGYCDHLLADPSMFEIAFDYARHSGPAGRIWLADNITRIPLGLGSAKAPPDAEEEAQRAAPAEGDMDLDVTIGAKHDYVLPGDSHQLEKLIRDCIANNLEAELQDICKIASETFVRQRRYGWAVSYAIRARDVRRLRWIAERLLQEYVRHGAVTFLRRASQLPDYFLLEGSEDEVPMPPDHAIFAAPLTFVCRYYLFQRLYSESEWREASELLVMLLKSRVAPRNWWGVLLWDSLPFLQEGEILIDYDDSLELLRCLEEIHTGSAYGGPGDYLEAMAGMLTKGEEITPEERKRVEKEALDKLSTLRCIEARVSYNEISL